MGYEFITGMGLKIDYVSVFEGAPGVPADLESEKSEIWTKYRGQEIRPG